MSMPTYDWYKLHDGDPLLMPLRIAFAAIAILILTVILGLR